MSEYRTIEGVELVTAGMDWPASTGPATITLEHLADMLTAANEDTHIQLPRVKLGHTSEVNGEMRVVDPFADLGDAAPAFGRVENLRLENDGAVLVGDLVEVPEWLAEAMPSSYPNRSAEITWAVTTAGGKTYSAVMTAIALLGTAFPAVSDLEDLERVVLGGPDALASKEEGMPRTTEASISAATVREKFNFDWATDPDNGVEADTYWWWARDVRLDPNEVIADDDEGGLWSISFETDGKDEVTFGDPVRVREEYVPVTTNANEAAARLRQRTDQQVLATNLERPDKPAPTAAQRHDNEEEEDMSIDMDALRQRLGLPEDADEEQINEALSQEPEEAEVDPVPEGSEAEPVAASADESTVTVERGAFEELQRQAREGAAARAEQLTERREKVLNEAVRAGKIAPASKDAWRAKLSEAPEATEAEIERLPEGLIPVEETGRATTEAEGEVPANVLASFGINRS